MLKPSKEATLLTLILFGLCHLNAVWSDDSDDIARNAKHFSLFSVVTFKNDECSSETTFNGGAVTGTCYSTTECSDKDGSKSGNCASGFGVCCIFIYNTLTSASISENRTYIENPLYPNTETSGAGTTTTYTLTKMQSDICQIRLDFDYFVIAGPAGTAEYGKDGVDGNCNDKWTTTLTGGARVPTLCGVMTGMHIYMDLGFDASDTAAIALALASTTITASDTGITVANAFRKWRVKTSQIPCWADYRAPPGCHQYFMQITGKISSPNFSLDPAGTAVTANQLHSGFDLMNQDMRYCLRREMGYCCVLWQVCNEFNGIDLTVVIAGGTVLNGELAYISDGWSFHTFTLGGGQVANKAVADNDIGLTDAECTTDYLEIPDSHTGSKSYGAAMQTNTRYCGHRLGNIPSITVLIGYNSHAPIWDCTEPFEANYFTDQQNDAGANANAAPPAVQRARTGMCLDFRQDAC